jgi:hypothetical protein
LQPRLTTTSRPPVDCRRAARQREETGRMPKFVEGAMPDANAADKIKPVLINLDHVATIRGTHDFYQCISAAGTLLGFVRGADLEAALERTPLFNASFEEAAE